MVIFGDTWWFPIFLGVISGEINVWYKWISADFLRFLVISGDIWRPKTWPVVNVKHCMPRSLAEWEGEEKLAGDGFMSKLCLDRHQSKAKASLNSSFCCQLDRSWQLAPDACYRKPLLSFKPGVSRRRKLKRLDSLEWFWRVQLRTGHPSQRLDSIECGRSDSYERFNVDICGLYTKIIRNPKELIGTLH